MAAELVRTVIDRITDVDDREIHTSVVSWPDYPKYGPFLDIREYIPSKDRYGRGVYVPLAYADRIAKAAQEALSHG